VLDRWGLDRGSVRMVLTIGTSPDDLRRRLDETEGVRVSRFRIEKHDGELVALVRLVADRGHPLGPVITELAGWAGVRDLRTE
jgi:hypothetical protein